MAAWVAMLSAGSSVLVSGERNKEGRAKASCESASDGWYTVPEDA